MTVAATRNVLCAAYTILTLRMYLSFWIYYHEDFFGLMCFTGLIMIVNYLANIFMGICLLGEACCDYFLSVLGFLPVAFTCLSCRERSVELSPAEKSFWNIYLVLATCYIPTCIYRDYRQGAGIGIAIILITVSYFVLCFSYVCSGVPEDEEGLLKTAKLDRTHARNAAELINIRSDENFSASMFSTTSTEIVSQAHGAI